MSKPSTPRLFQVAQTGTLSILALAASLAAQATSTRPVAAIGDQAPGVADGMCFQYLRHEVTAADSTAFVAGLHVLGDRTAKTRPVTEGGRGVWVADAKGLHLVARSDQAAPGIDHAVFNTFSCLAVGPASHVLFVVNLKPNQIASTKRSGKKRNDPDHTIPPGASQALYLAEPGKELRLLLRSGDPVPDHAGLEWKSFDFMNSPPSISATGAVALRATSAVAAQQERTDFWLLDSGGVTRLADETVDVTPLGGVGPTIAANGAVLFGAAGRQDHLPFVARSGVAPASLGKGALRTVHRFAAADGGDPVCHATLNSADGNSCIVRLSTAGPEVLVHPGMPIANAGEGARVGQLAMNAVAGNGTVMFVGSYDTNECRSPAILMAHGGVVTAVAIAGKPVPGAESTLQFASFDAASLACNRHGQGVFFAETKASSLRTDPKLVGRALFAFDGSRCWQLAAPGRELDLGGGRLRRVIHLDLVRPQPLADDGSLRLVVTWKLAGDESKMAAMPDPDGRSHGIYAVHLGKATTKASPAQQDPAKPPAAPADASAVLSTPAKPVTAAPTYQAEPGKLRLPANTHRAGIPDPAALRAAADAAQSAWKALDRSKSPLRVQVLQMRQSTLYLVARTIDSWAATEQLCASDEAKLRQLQALGPSRETERLTRELEERKRALAEAKQHYLDAVVVRRELGHVMLTRFLLDAKATMQAAGQPRSRADHSTTAGSRIVNDMEDTRTRLASLFQSPDLQAGDQELIRQLNDIAAQIALLAASGSAIEVQDLCDAVVAWILDDNATLPGK